MSILNSHLNQFKESHQRLVRVLRQGGGEVPDPGGEPTHFLANLSKIELKFKIICPDGAHLLGGAGSALSIENYMSQLYNRS